MNWENIKAVVQHYVLYDRQCRRSVLFSMGLVNLPVFAITFLMLIGKVPWLILMMVLLPLSFGSIFGCMLVLAMVIHREKSEGSFRLLRGLPLSSKTLYYGTVWAGFVACVVAILPAYAVAILSLILDESGVVSLFIYSGCSSILMAFGAASITVAFMFCVNSPTVLSFLTMVPGLIMTIVTGILLWFSQEESLRVWLLELVLQFDLPEKLRYLVFSLQGRLLVLLISTAVFLIIYYAGAHIFSRKRSYV